MFFHGGGYCSGSIASHRRMVTEAGRCAGARTLAVGYRLAPEHPFPAAFDDALVAWRFLRRQGIAAARIAVGGRQRRRRPHGGADQPSARKRRRAARLRVARLAVDRPDDVRINDGQQRRRGPPHSQAVPRGVGHRVSPRNARPEGSACVRALCGLARIPTGAGAGRLRRDLAR